MILFALALVLVSNFVMTHAYLFKRGYDVNPLLMAFSGSVTGFAVVQLILAILK